MTAHRQQEHEDAEGTAAKRRFTCGAVIHPVKMLRIYEWQECDSCAAAS